MSRTVVLDSDALIKLGKAGLLRAATRAWRCLVPDEVYPETVVRGLREAHPDADEIAALFSRGLERVRVRRRAAGLRLGSGLGAGERAAATLMLQARADCVITDDRAFLRELRRVGLPHVTPALAAVELFRSGALSPQEALASLERLRPMVRHDRREAARTDLNALAKEDGRA